MASRQKILFISPVSQGSLRQRHQAMALELVKAGFEVIFIEPLKTFGFGIRWQKTCYDFQAFEVLVPFKGVNHYYIQLLASVAAAFIIIKRLKLACESTVLWLSDPSMFALGLFKWHSFIYDRCDYHGHFKGQSLECFKKYETVLFERADVISVSHPFLKNDIKGQNASKVVYASNACSKEFISLCAALPKRIKRDGDKIKIVSSGAHFEWVDFNFLFMLAHSEQTELHIAGTGRTKNFYELIKKENVFFHGTLNQNELARLLTSCDAAALPFLDTDLIKGVDPVKTYEFAAAGLPIWAPRVESLRANPLISEFIASSEELKAAIKRVKPQKNKNLPLWSEQALKILKAAKLKQ